MNEYLHWHHTNARLSTTKVIRPLVAKLLGGATPEDLVTLEKKDEVVTKYIELIEKFLVKDYVAHSDAPTLADYALYCELDQLEITKAFDFAQFPKISAWIARMKVRFDFV